VEGGDDTGGTAGNKARARSRHVDEPSHERCADGRAAEEDQDVERHHPSPHRVAGGDLDAGVGCRRHREECRPGDDEQDPGQQQVRHQPGGGLGHAEGERTAGDEPRRRTRTADGEHGSPDRAERDQRGQQPVGGGRSVECLPSEQGERHREVQAEHADDSDEDDR